MPKRTDRAFAIRFNAALGSRIQAMRLKKGLTQAELTEMAELGRATLAMIETGRQGVYALDLVRISMALRVRPTALLPKLPLRAGKK